VDVERQIAPSAPVKSPLVASAKMQRFRMWGATRGGRA